MMISWTESNSEGRRNPTATGITVQCQVLICLLQVPYSVSQGIYSVSFCYFCNKGCDFTEICYSSIKPSSNGKH